MSAAQHSRRDAAPVNFKIVQNPDLTLILYEEFNHFRQVHTDGRALPIDPQPAWLGIQSANGIETCSWSRPSASTTDRGWTTQGTRTARR